MMNRIMLGIQGIESDDQMKKVVDALARQKGVLKTEVQQLGQVTVEYDPHRLTVMDLIRAVREEGFLAGML
ncbi:MAG TPA: cation transporter [Oceanithermus profundus]|uniref:Cation transporter n=1 Tax=Oceanithermus profundus TaxID=187137 RepID=A0A7C4ZRR9_9DEIN|nr:cation transporter [Oceanithermus profundus]